ncbi:MAG TPA: hypothetical protein VG347_12025 [Verrucomicrobiae bacterium]|nr:hypothetical protein [Verrucomicrobiae bacterium]
MGLRRFPLNLMHYGNSYYLERVVALEKMLAKRPRQLQIELMGEGEMQAEWALLIRSILQQRSPETQVIIHARSSLLGATVLVWLSGDRRLIREDARIFFRRATTSVNGETNEDAVWEEGTAKSSDTFTDADPEEASYARALQLINEFLPVKELAGRMIEVPTLRQFGLVENEKLDRFLAAAFGGPQVAETSGEPKAKRLRTTAKGTGAGALKK